MGPFPKQRIMPSRKINIITFDIDLLCCCSIPDVTGLGPWIVCDIGDQWYLQKCEGIYGKKIPKNKKYTCKKCKY